VGAKLPEVRSRRQDRAVDSPWNPEFSSFVVSAHATRCKWARFDNTPPPHSPAPRPNGAPPGIPIGDRSPRLTRRPNRSVRPGTPGAIGPTHCRRRDFAIRTGFVSGTGGRGHSGGLRGWPPLTTFPSGIPRPRPDPSTPLQDTAPGPFRDTRGGGGLVPRCAIRGPEVRRPVRRSPGTWIARTCFIADRSGNPPEFVSGNRPRPCAPSTGRAGCPRRVVKERRPGSEPGAGRAGSGEWFPDAGPSP
jgi:hypothetical protein